MMAGRAGANAFEKLSSLCITAGEHMGRVYLKELSFTAPFKVMAPFIKPDGTLQVMPLTASAGILEGDTQEIQIETGQGTKLEVVSQSYEKIHKMITGSARRDTCLHVGKDSLLLYRPLPVIPFKQSAFDSRTQIVLEDSTSRLAYQEILSCGRAAAGERFRYRYYHSLVEARRSGCLVYRENCRFHPDRDFMEEVGFFEGYSHLANLLLFQMGAEHSVDKIRRLIGKQEDVSGGVTLTAASDVVVRILGNQAQTLQKICDDIIDLVRKQETSMDIHIF